MNIFQIIDLEDGHELSHGEEGEVLIRGDVTMLGYLDNPEATAEGLDDDGWWKSGTHVAMGNISCRALHRICSISSGVWCRGLTTYLLYVGPLFGNLVWNESGFVSLT